VSGLPPCFTLTLPLPCLRRSGYAQAGVKGEAYQRMGVKIDPLKCVGCGQCTYVCPVDVLRVEDMKCRVREGCISCGECVERCHWQAITLEDGRGKKKKMK
jgi:NAD-dependent dihydropyrimidine dehydrogenase PreA subunit